MNRANSIRPRRSKLKLIAEKTGCAVVIIGHLNKKAGGKVDYRGLGSIDIQAAARSVLLIGKHTDYPGFRFVVQQKNNLAPLSKTLGFTLDNGVVKWLGTFRFWPKIWSSERQGKRVKSGLLLKLLRTYCFEALNQANRFLSGAQTRAFLNGQLIMQRKN